MTYGPQRLISDLIGLGYQAELVNAGGIEFAIIRKYEVEIGRFRGRVIDLGIMATADYPRTVTSAIHVCAEPQLLETGNLPEVRNITSSQIGGEWRYWSHNFQWNEERTTRRLVSQINGVFKDA